MTHRSTQRTIVIVAVIGLFFVACSRSISHPQLRDPFTTRSVGEDGIVVGWSGYTEGYQPDPGLYERYSVDLSLKNESDSEWRGRLCLFLLDGQGVVADLGQQDLTLDPGAAMGMPHALRFPTDLAEGAYGLTLVVHKPEGPFANVVTIHIGDTSEIYASQESALQAALDDCPAPVQTRAD